MKGKLHRITLKQELKTNLKHFINNHTNNYTIIPGFHKENKFVRSMVKWNQWQQNQT